MKTQGTALEGLLQQEREALEREQAAAAETDSVDPKAQDETVGKEDVDGNNIQTCAGGEQSAQPLREGVAA